MGWTISSERHDERPTYAASGAVHIATCLPAWPAIVPLVRPVCVCVCGRLNILRAGMVYEPLTTESGYGG
jgi:hypothetical protein